MSTQKAERVRLSLVMTWISIKDEIHCPVVLRCSLLPIRDIQLLVD
jgi:hypothetical protein